MGRWIAATGFSLSALINIIVIARLSETRRDLEELRRRAPRWSSALAAPLQSASAQPGEAPIPFAPAPARADRNRDAGQPTPLRATVSNGSLLEDLDRIDAFWKTLAKLSDHVDGLGDEYPGAVLELTTAFLGVDAAVIRAGVKRMNEEQAAAETDEAYEAARVRVSGLLRPDLLRTHRAFLARLGDWVNAIEIGTAGSGGVFFPIESDK